MQGKSNIKCPVTLDPLCFARLHRVFRKYLPNLRHLSWGGGDIPIKCVPNFSNGFVRNFLSSGRIKGYGYIIGRFLHSKCQNLYFKQTLIPLKYIIIPSYITNLYYHNTFMGYYILATCFGRPFCDHHQGNIKPCVSFMSAYYGMP
jgi:hypothetical protein